jgi:hypothetical protein
MSLVQILKPLFQIQNFVFRKRFKTLVWNFKGLLNLNSNLCSKLFDSKSLFSSQKSAKLFPSHFSISAHAAQKPPASPNPFSFSSWPRSLAPAYSHAGLPSPLPTQLGTMTHLPIVFPFLALNKESRRCHRLSATVRASSCRLQCPEHRFLFTCGNDTLSLWFRLPISPPCAKTEALKVHHRRLMHSLPDASSPNGLEPYKRWLDPSTHFYLSLSKR